MPSNHPFIGIVMNLGEADREISARRDAFLEGVQPGPGARITVPTNVLNGALVIR